jgi:lipoprotein-releasing system ATP-binding protein
VVEHLLELRKISKIYNQGQASEARVLHDVDLILEQGEFVAIMGPSGSGKSTLLNIIGVLDRPTSGQMFILGQDITQLDDAGLTRLRGRSIGFVFQYHHLIPAFTAVENVMMPMVVDRGSAEPHSERLARKLIERVGLSKVADNLATNMSGGQQQRIALARALIMTPKLLLADEPTGNLDSHSADEVFHLMREVNRQSGTSFVIVTHNRAMAEQCDRIIDVVDGHIRLS